MPVVTNSTPSPVAHLTEADIEQLGHELDTIRQDVIDARGERDAAYIRRVIDTQRRLELAGRAILILGSRNRAAWVVGTACLTLAKVLDNMEIGHNVLHGQYDWMRDPKIHSTTWDWDHPSPPEQWQQAHNQTHHTYTNILGKDNDLGYGIMRVDEEQPWEPRHLAQPIMNFFTACLFDYGIAAYDMELGTHLREKRGLTPELRSRMGAVLTRVRKQVVKDYVVHPLLSGRGALRTAAASATANLVRNVWSHSVIMCGHFPEGVQTFELDALDENESRGEWYLRQMLGSANISGSPAMHLLSGNLSHQIEHHLFPDLPSSRYAEISTRVRELFDKYDLRYHAAPLPKQVASAWHRVLRLSLPNGWLDETTWRNAPGRVAELVRTAAQGSQGNQPAALAAG